MAGYGPQGAKHAEPIPSQQRPDLAGDRADGGRTENVTPSVTGAHEGRKTNVSALNHPFAEG